MAGLIQNNDLFGADIPAIGGLREKAGAYFALPSPKTEAWKYTKLHALKADDFVMLPSKFLAEIEEEGHVCSCHCHEHGDGCCCGNDSGCGANYPRSAVETLPFAVYPFYFSNGQFIPVYPALPQGVEVMTLMEAAVSGAVKNYLGKYIDWAAYPFAALNTKYLEEGLFIKIGRGVRLDRPLLILNRSTPGDNNLFANLHNVVVAENGAEATLLEWYDYAGAPKSRYFNNIVNEIYLQGNARLNHYKLQDEAFKAVHIALNRVRVQENAVYNGFCLQKGADLGRNETKLDLLREHAKAEVNAAYIMNGWATLDTTTDIEHIAPKTYSSQLVKGAAGGEARGVFQGRIHIYPDAQETEGYQLHRAMLLSDDAEIDVKPELRIYADNVKCSHGAACGELDKEQLFYLRSRGIGEEEARRILIDAYLTDAVNRIDEPAVRDWFATKVTGK